MEKRRPLDDYATINPNFGPDAGQTTAHWFKIRHFQSGLPNCGTTRATLAAKTSPAGTYTFFPSIAVSMETAIWPSAFLLQLASIFSQAPTTLGDLRAIQQARVQPSGVPCAQGVDFYVRTFGTPGVDSNRWGDYSGISVDPSNDATFWVFNEYAITRGTVIRCRRRSLGHRLRKLQHGHGSACATCISLS